MAETKSAPGPIATRWIGANLANVRSWETDPPTRNLFKVAAPWVSLSPSGGWGHGPALDLDDRGFVRSLAPGCSAIAILWSEIAQTFPGEYIVEWEGTGVVGAWCSVGTSTVLGPNRIRIVIPPVTNPPGKVGSIYVEVKGVDPTSPPRNFSIVQQGVAYPSIFRPQFTRNLSIYGGFRLMDWASTNNHPPYDWADRPLTEDEMWSSERGVPIEVMIALAKQTNKIPWINIPHTYDDAMVRATATLWHANLQKGLPIRVAHSNEVWNSGTFQHPKAIAAMAWASGLVGDELTVALQWHAQRTAAIGAIFREVCVGREVEVVLEGWVGQEYHWRLMLDHIEKVTGKPARASIDTIAGGVYFGDRFGYAAIHDPDHWEIITDPDWGDKVDAMTDVDILDLLLKQDVPDAIVKAKRDVGIAAEYGVAASAYETGQHVVGVGDRMGDEVLAKRFSKINAHPRMAGVYHEFLKQLRAIGIVHPQHFTHCGAWSKYGCWGALQHQLQNQRHSPKYQALAREGL